MKQGENRLIFPIVILPPQLPYLRLKNESGFHLRELAKRGMRKDGCRK